MGTHAGTKLPFETDKRLDGLALCRECYIQNKAFQEPSITFELGSLCDLQLRNQAVDLNILQKVPRRDNEPSRCQDIKYSWKCNSKYMSVQYGWAAVILGQLLYDVSWRDRNQRHQKDLRLEAMVTNRRF